MEPAAPVWLGQEQPRDGPASKTPRLDTWTQLAASQALEKARKVIFEDVATTTPPAGYTRLWTPDKGRNLPLKIRFDNVFASVA
jgi:hypothetical protein